MAENLLTVENLGKSFREKQLFDGISFGVNKGQKIALVARNGAGKTTLLNIIAKNILPDSGEVSFRNNIHYIYLEQNPYLDSELSVLDVIFRSDNPTMVAVRGYEEAMYLVSKKDSIENQDKLIASMSEMDRLSAWDYESRAKEILSKLGITNLDQKVGTLSGGEKKKVALSKVLIEDCDLLVLDEPTNHLDVEMIEWLEEFLKRSSLTLLVVTHDRYFINNVCTDVYEIDRGKVFKYRGDYNGFLVNKEQRETIYRQEVEKAKNLYRKELEWMRRMPQARTTKSKARIEAFYDLKDKTEVKFEDKARDLSIEGRRLGRKILEINNISKKFDDKIILDDFSYTFKSGEKIGIIGTNGVGKSTFLNIITERAKADSGKISIGETIEYGYYTQGGLEEKEDMRVIDIIKEVAESIKLNDRTELSATLFLSYFGFGTDLQYNFYSNLSGGERRRLYLLKVLISNPNFLILDEPTNDLDIYNLGVLENFLKEYQGCLLIVSHDRSFMDNLVDHLFVFEGQGKIRDYHSNYSDYLETKNEEDKLKAEEEKKLNEIEKSKPKKAEPLVLKDETQRKLSYKEKLEFESIENDLPILEKEKKDISNKLSSGELSSEELVSLSLRYQEVDSDIEEKEMRWIELSEYL